MRAGGQDHSGDCIFVHTGCGTLVTSLMAISGEESMCPPEVIPVAGSSGTSVACPSGKRARRRCRRLCNRHCRLGSTTSLVGTATRCRQWQWGRSCLRLSRCCQCATASGSIRPISYTSHVSTREIKASFQHLLL